jgi:hypothetical protein
MVGDIDLIKAGRRAQPLRRFTTSRRAARANRAFRDQRAAGSAGKSRSDDQPAGRRRSDQAIRFAPLDVTVFTANSEDRTARGKITARAC